MQSYLTDLTERKALITRIIPKVPTAGGRWGLKLDWSKYMASNPLDATLLGYDQRETKPELWNRNNVMARDMLERGQVKSKKSTSTLDKRRKLLLEIWPQLEETPEGSKRWRNYFEKHPEHAKELGYGSKNPKEWAANLRITQHDSFKAEARANAIAPLEPYKVTVPESEAVQNGIRELEEKAWRVREENLEAEVKELKARLRESQETLEKLKSEHTVAALITLDLMMQLRSK